MQTAKLLHSHYSTGGHIHQPREFELLDLAERVCIDPAVNTTDFGTSNIDILGPAVYLIKLLVRQYGFPCLKTVAEEHQWIVPQGLRTTNQVGHFIVLEDLIRNETII